jgi:hypothetical protein
MFRPSGIIMCFSACPVHVVAQNSGGTRSEKLILCVPSKQWWNTQREAHFVPSLKTVVEHAARSSFCWFPQNSGGTRSEKLILFLRSKQWWNTQREAHFVCSLKTVVEHAARSSFCSFAQNSG